MDINNASDTTTPQPFALTSVERQEPLDFGTGPGILVPRPEVRLPTLRIFQPTLRPRQRDTGWLPLPDGGQCRTVGRLGQRHYAIIQAAMSLALRKRVVLGSDGLPESVAVDLRLADLRRSVGRTVQKDAGRYGQQTILRQLRDMQAAIVDLKIKVRGVFHETHDPLLTGFEVTHRSDAPGRMLELRFGKAIVLACGLTRRDDDIPSFAEPACTAPLRSGTAIAIVNYITAFDHEPPGGWNIRDVLRILMPEMAGADAIRNRRREIRNATRDLAGLGVEVREKTLHRVRH